MTCNGMPCFVEAIGERLGMTPISWKEYPDRVVIVFEQGPKLEFTREIEAEPAPTPKPKKQRKTKKK